MYPVGSVKLLKITGGEEKTYFASFVHTLIPHQKPVATSSYPSLGQSNVCITPVLDDNTTDGMLVRIKN